MGRSAKAAIVAKTHPEKNKTPNGTIAKQSRKQTTPKKRKWRPGTVALREIKQYQKSTECLVKPTPFNRIIDNFLDEFSANANSPFRMKRDARQGLRIVSGNLITNLFKEAYKFTINAKRVTLQPKDLQLAVDIFIKKITMNSSQSDFGSTGKEISYKINEDAEPRQTKNSLNARSNSEKKKGAEEGEDEEEEETVSAATFE
jgi:histone H3